jgi:hypothetical protein
MSVWFNLSSMNQAAAQRTAQGRTAALTGPKLAVIVERDSQNTPEFRTKGNGEGGIRTRGPGLSRDKRLAGAPDQPLQHLSTRVWTAALFYHFSEFEEMEFRENDLRNSRGAIPFQEERMISRMNRPRPGCVSGKAF